MIERVEQSAPRLSRLELHGFKSFATRTPFVFEPGITAIVGPNGSGKSNISDALRWVLGETSYAALRGKKTEDVIFAGGKGKAPTGMAEVTVTFNNEERWLPSEFTEVTVTRRAYRGGENQYLINGRRVRLKDVALLTASLGQSYTVVGQGLVDAALSQRADERRGLFEHAADLTGLRLKVGEAERSLAEADGNVQRLTDLLTEVEPRLRSLGRAARQAREWQGVRNQLSGWQRRHYRRLLIDARARLDAANCEVARGYDALEAAESDITRATDELTAATAATDAARDRLAQHDARLDALREQHRKVEHERDIVGERQRALDHRRRDMIDTQAGLDEQFAQTETDLAALTGQLQQLGAEADAVRRAAEAARARAASGRDQRAARERRAQEIARALAGHERRLGELGQRGVLLRERRETTVTQQARAGEEAGERNARIVSLENELIAFGAEDDRIAGGLTTIDRRLTELAADLASREQAARAADDAVAAIEKKLGQATNHLDVLRRVHESGTGLYAGVRQVMKWRRDGSLTGIRGTVADLIRIDQTYDTAIEVALGGHTQDVVVERWADAEATIGALMRANAGRATFQPLDTVGRGTQRPAPREVLTATGVHGVAADLVVSDADVAVVIQGLLGRTVVVDDLPAARRVLPALPPGWSAVTLAGEIARAGGSVTGGSAVRESGMLTRARELRELPDQIESHQRERATAIEARERVGEEVRALGQERQRIESERAGLVAMRKERTGQRDRLASWLRDSRAQHGAGAARIAQAEAAIAAIDRDLAALDADETALQRTIETVRAEHAAVQAEITALRDGSTGDDEALQSAQRELAILDERLRAERRREGGLRARQAALTEERAHRAEVLAGIDGERAALADQRDRLDGETASLAAALATAEDERAPLHEAVAHAHRAAEALAARLDAARQAQSQRERAVGQQELTAERMRSEVDGIRQRITDDLELEDPDALRGMEDESDEPLPDDIEREITRLKERLRRVGYVGEDAVAEYEREAAHHEFLTTQLADVTGSAAQLRQLLAELHETMRERFETTFAKVAEAFTAAFTTLFGGGTARLVMIEEEDGTRGGIDVVAQPPGKRLQNLALLSGGERSLTAVALLFAILRVNPSPFVLLDEVDAALDEANVVRFRDELRKLARETQAIVITHNRGTVEIADTLYGITMGDDGISQTLSLRLSELPLGDDLAVRDLPTMTAAGRVD
jgi:chromosome segregation protein